MCINNTRERFHFLFFFKQIMPISFGGWRKREGCFRLTLFTIREIGRRGGKAISNSNSRRGYHSNSAQSMLRDAWMMLLGFLLCVCPNSFSNPKYGKRLEKHFCCVHLAAVFAGVVVSTADQFLCAHTRCFSHTVLNKKLLHCCCTACGLWWCAALLAALFPLLHEQY